MATLSDDEEDYLDMLNGQSTTDFLLNQEFNPAEQTAVPAGPKLELEQFHPSPSPELINSRNVTIV
jgi:hypothetical protein